MSTHSQDPPTGGFRLSTRLDNVLLRASRDPAFLDDLGSRGAQAAVDAGFELTASERAVLDSIRGHQLNTMVSSLPEREQRRPFEQVLCGGIRPDFDPIIDGEKEISRGTRPIVPIALAAAGTVLLGGAAAGMLLVTGSRPDEPPPVTTAVATSVPGSDGDAGDDADADADASDGEGR